MVLLVKCASFNAWFEADQAMAHSVWFNHSRVVGNTRPRRQMDLVMKLMNLEVNGYSPIVVPR